MPSYTAIDWYETPRYYDAIFDVDTDVEADFLEAVHAKHGTGRTSPAPRVLEPACGSGRLLVHMARRGWRVHGFDLEPAMVRYSRDRLREEGLRGTVTKGDMSSFEVRGSFDLAHCFVSTFKYLLDEDAARRHLELVADALAPGGVYCLGFHLTDYAATKSTRERWHVVQDGADVTCTIEGWPAERKARREKVRSRLVVREGGEERRSETVWWFRTYDARQVRSLLRSVSALEHVATYDFLYDADEELKLSDAQYDTLLVPEETGRPGAAPAERRKVSAPIPKLLPRFVALDIAAQATRATPLESRESLRRAALILALAPTDGVEAEGLVTQWRASVRDLEALGGFGSPFRSSRRHVAAALGFVGDVRRFEFVEAVAETMRRFAEVGARGPRGRRIVDAALLVMEGALTHTGIVPTFERVRRLVEGEGVAAARPALDGGPVVPPLHTATLAALRCLAPPPTPPFAEELTAVLLAADAVERSALAAGVATAR